MSSDSDVGGSIEAVSEQYRALVNVLKNPPPNMSHASAIQLCADNFADALLVALAHRKVSVETALRSIQLSNSSTGNNVFADVDRLGHLVSEIAGHLIEQVRGTLGVSTHALASLRGFVARPHEVGQGASLLAFHALVKGCLRCFSTVGPNQGETVRAPDPVAELELLAPDLIFAARDHAAEIVGVINVIAMTEVDPPLEKGITAILKQLSDPTQDIPELVRSAAETALSRRRVPSDAIPPLADDE
jgi:hypothetical protein